MSVAVLASYFGDEKNYDVESCDCVKDAWGI